MTDPRMSLTLADMSMKPTTKPDFLDSPMNLSQLVHWMTALQVTIHERNRRWWFDADGNRLERNKGELLALIHSEISECLEAVRKPGLMDHHLPHRPNEAVELADALIRILDYAEGAQLNVVGAMIDKLEFNRTREDHKREAALKSGGKQF